jgi:hypothetical protein
MGDLVDNHAISFHETDPNLHSPLDELDLAIEYVESLYDIFPRLDILQGNHDKLPVRKAKNVGLPSRYIKNNHEVFNMPRLWRWHMELDLILPTGQKLWLRHNLKKDALEVAKFYNTCFAQGHFHTVLDCNWTIDSNRSVFGINTGCLIDDKSLAMEYNKANLHRPQLGCVIIINGLPQIVPMILDDSGDWTGELE